MQPPSGYVFDAAVATTFSLDFETALAVPVSLALFAAESREDILANPLALLEGAERIAGRLVIFAAAGHIHAQSQPQSRLSSLLDRMIVDVAKPGGGTFHPKMWALRFKPIKLEEPARIRLLVLSRNLTRDRSWDISLQLDGEIGRRPRNLNKPLVRLLNSLPTLAVSGLSDEARKLTTQMAEYVHLAEWEVPEPFEAVSFAVNGLGGRSWQPEACAKLGVISPFCDPETLQLLAALPRGGKPTLIGRADELAAIAPEILSDFERVCVLDEIAATEDGEELPRESLQGLHAKAFVSETGWDTTITVGSGNATRPALISGRNVELFATLSGKRSRVGSVDDIFGSNGFGRLTHAFDSTELAALDPETRDAEMRVDEARRALSLGALQLRCERVSGCDTHDALWRLWAVPTGPLLLAGVGALSVWPITRGEDHCRDALEALRTGQQIDLGELQLIDVTRFLACRLTDASKPVSALFSVCLLIDGLPAERHAAILRWVIDSREAFFRYLRLLLSELGDPFGAALAAQNGGGNGAWRTAADDAPLLEEMVRALCRGGEQLHAIERLITRLESPDLTGPDPVPVEFRELWAVFRFALKEQGL
ncbi:MAG: phospholipase D family protein [Pseudomonadota bacterium]